MIGDLLPVLEPNVEDQLLRYLASEVEIYSKNISGTRCLLCPFEFCHVPFIYVVIYYITVKKTCILPTNALHNDMSYVLYLTNVLALLQFLLVGVLHQTYCSNQQL